MVKKPQSKALLRYTNSKKYNVNDYYRFNGVPVSVAERLLTGHPNVSKREYQGRSPSMMSMVNLAKKYNGCLEGYVIVGEHNLSKIVFDGVYLTFSRVVPNSAEKLVKRLKPDEFDYITTEITKKNKYYPAKCAGKYRFWWD